MKMPVSKMLVALTVVMACVGCAHSQVPPTTHTVALTWTATSSGGTAPYSYIMSRITLTTGTKSCPAVNYATPNYSPLNSSSPVSGTSFTDTGATGTVCYVVQAQDSVKAIGNASNTAGPMVLPTNPSQPVTLGGTVTADLQQPALPKPSEGADAPPVVAKLEARIQ
jgi:hypothetical protein